MGLLLGVDAGTTSVKAGLFGDNGDQLAVATEEYRLITPSAERAELDPETYWRATTAAVRRALAASGASPAEVVALAVSSQGETVVALDGDGKPLSNAIVWLDNRAEAEAREVAERFADDLVYAVTGVPAVVPTWTACKLLWWKRHEPALFARAARFVLVEDLLLYRLTGRYVTEGGVQCTTLLYDIGAQRWWRPMLDVLEVDDGRLPELAAPGEVVGELLPAAAEALGLRARLPIVAGGMDQGAGAVGVGNVRPGSISESTGGALTVQATIDRTDGDATRQTPVYVHSAKGHYLYCPVCPTGGMALTWFRDRFGASVEAPGKALSYDQLTGLAARVPPGSEGLIMLPHLMGAFSPEYEPAARGVFFGFTLGHGKGHFVRAILESVAFMLRRNLELLSAAGASAAEIRSHGGGARSDLWCQIKADVCGLPVVTLEGSDAAVRGNAMLAGVATGVYAGLDEATQAMVKPIARFEPDAATHAAYDAAFRRYVELFDAVRPLFTFDKLSSGGTDVSTLAT